jgi:hypothetical protein
VFKKITMVVVVLVAMVVFPAILADTSPPPPVGWSSYIPTAGNQGQYGSCTSWAMAYDLSGMDAIYHRNVTDMASEQTAIYDSCHHASNGGVAISDAADALVSNGSIAEWAWLFWAADSNNTQIIKSALAQGPVVAAAGVYIDHKWTDGTATLSDVSDNFDANHAICICGYDDSHMTADGAGAFRFVNSWGTNWGQDGFGWMSYKFAATQVVEAVSLFLPGQHPATHSMLMSIPVNGIQAVVSANVLVETP